MKEAKIIEQNMKWSIKSARIRYSFNSITHFVNIQKPRWTVDFRCVLILAIIRSTTESIEQHTDESVGNWYSEKDWEGRVFVFSTLTKRWKSLSSKKLGDLKCKDSIAFYERRNSETIDRWIQTFNSQKGGMNGFKLDFDLTFGDLIIVESWFFIDFNEKYRKVELYLHSLNALVVSFGSKRVRNSSPWKRRSRKSEWGRISSLIWELIDFLIVFLISWMQWRKQRVIS